MRLASSLLPLVASRLLSALPLQNHYTFKMYTILINHSLSHLLQLPPYLLITSFHQKFYHIAPFTTSVAIFTVNSMFTLMNHSVCLSFLLSLHLLPLHSINSRAPWEPCAQQKLNLKHSDIWQLFLNLPPNLLGTPAAKILWFPKYPICPPMSPLSCFLL